MINHNRIVLTPDILVLKEMTGKCFFDPKHTGECESALLSGVAFPTITLDFSY